MKTSWYRSTLPTGRLPDATRCAPGRVLLLTAGFAGCWVSGCGFRGDGDGQASNRSESRRVVAQTAPGEPAPGESAPGESAPGEPAASEPAASEPAASEPAPVSLSGDPEHARMITLLGIINDEFQANHPAVSRALGVDLRRRYDEARQRGDPRMAFVATIQLADHLLNMGEGKTAHRLYSAGLRALPMIRSRFGDFLTTAQEAKIQYDRGNAALRRAENENCLCCTDGESCLFPISDQGVHRKDAGARDAVEAFAATLRLLPDSKPAAWQLNLAAMLSGQFPDAVPADYRISREALQGGGSVTFPKFSNRSVETGVATLSLAGGAVADDFDGDGWPDLVVTNWNPEGQVEFFRNQRNGGFVNATAEANLTGVLGGLNLSHADVDNDGDLDLLVMRGGWLQEFGQLPHSLLINDGRGHFVDRTVSWGLDDSFFPTQTSAWADIDNDGDLDLYVGNEGPPNELMLNENGRFKSIAVEAGVDDPGTMTKGVCWGDVNEDGLADLYVSNFGKENRLFLNNGDLTFTETAAAAGVEEPIDGFPCWFWDFNNDGHLDLYASQFVQGVEHIYDEMMGTPSLNGVDAIYVGDGNGGFEDLADQLGVRTVTQPMGCNFGDLDNDGFLDYYLGTGYPENEGVMPNRMFWNRGGTRFDEVTAQGGFGHLQKGHGVAFVDFDHDGDQDVFAELGGWFRGDAFQNALFVNPGFDNRWIKISLRGTRSNRYGVGAKISLTIEPEHGERQIHRWVGFGSSFGGNSLRQHVGLASADTVSRIDVCWPATGETQTFTDVAADQWVELVEGDPEPQFRKWSASDD